MQRLQKWLQALAVFGRYHEHRDGPVGRQPLGRRDLLAVFTGVAMGRPGQPQEDVGQVAGSPPGVERFDKLRKEVVGGQHEIRHVGGARVRAVGQGNHGTAAEGAHGIDGARIVQEQGTGARMGVGGFLGKRLIGGAQGRQVVDGQHGLKPGKSCCLLQKRPRRCLAVRQPMGHDRQTLQGGHGHIGGTAQRAPFAAGGFQTRKIMIVKRI